MSTLLAFMLSAGTSWAGPKEIVFDEGEKKPARSLDELEQLAVDNALLDGATDIPDPMVFRTSNHELSQTLPLEGGKCYTLSGAFQTPYPVDMLYAFGRTVDARPMVDGQTRGRVRVGHRAGVVRFCVDRPGTVRLVLKMTEDLPTSQGSMEWVMVLASRPETLAQGEARRRAFKRNAEPEVEGDAAPPALPTPSSDQSPLPPPPSDKGQP